jgi:3-oxoadipate enol-lactonase
MLLRCRDIDVQVAEWGRGRPLVLVHGIGGDHRSWRGLVPHLAMERRVLAYDVRGHGGTSLGGADGTLRQLGEDLLALLDALRLERADVCGFSLGGTIVLQAAILAPARVDRLVAVATSSRVGRAARQWYSDHAAAAEQGPAALYAALDRDAAEGGGDAGEQARLRREAIGDGAGYANACRAMAAMGEAPLDGALAGIRAPSLIVAGERDPRCPPRAGEIVAGGIPGARLHVVPGAGHMLPQDHPTELARLVTEFLGSPP